ncbi:MAG TPA: hypothetical protein DCS36_04465, partial [Sphingobacterium sp.]|nr:hypothetical protein [Sphingobacterium sp.]
GITKEKLIAGLAIFCLTLAENFFLINNAFLDLHVKTCFLSYLYNFKNLRTKYSKKATDNSKIILALFHHQSNARTFEINERGSST